MELTGISFSEIVLIGTFAIAVSTMVITAINYIHINMVIKANSDKKYQETEEVKDIKKDDKNTSNDADDNCIDVLSKEEIEDLINKIDDAEARKTIAPLVDLSSNDGLYMVSVSGVKVGGKKVNETVERSMCNILDKEMITFSQKYEELIKKFTVDNEKGIYENQCLVSNGISNFLNGGGSIENILPYVMEFGEASSLVIDLRKIDTYAGIFSLLEVFTKVSWSALLSSAFSLHHKGKFKGVHTSLAAEEKCQGILEITSALTGKVKPSWSKLYKESYTGTSQDCKNRKEIISKHIFKHLSIVPLWAIDNNEKTTDKSGKSVRLAIKQGGSNVHYGDVHVLLDPSNKDGGRLLITLYPFSYNYNLNNLEMTVEFSLTPMNA